MPELATIKSLILGIILSILLIPNAWPNTEASFAEIDKSIRQRNYSKAVEQLQPLLKQNLANAQFRMAGMYRAGKGVKRNMKSAINLYEKAAIAGHADAQFALAALLEKQHAEISLIEHWYQAAADQGHTLAKKKLTKLGQNKVTDNYSRQDNQAIFDAVKRNQLEQIKDLQNRRVDVDVLDGQGRSTLLVALMAGHRDMAKLLLGKSRYANQPDNNSNRPIHIATRQGFQKLVENLIAADADLNAQDKLGNTALMIAVRHDDVSLVELLLKYNANVKLQNLKQRSAIDLANNINASKSLKLFRQKGLVQNPAKRNQTIVDLASFKRTVQQSASIYAGWPLINVASHLGEEDIVEQLIARKVDLDARDKQGNNALHRAAERGHLGITRMLYSAGAQLNARNRRKQTPLFLAAAAGKIKTLKFLLGKGAKSTITSTKQIDPLTISIINRHEQIAKILLKQPLAKKGIHQALLRATQSRMQDIAIRLTKQSSMLDKVDQKGRSVLWYSVDLGLTDLTKTLLNNPRPISLNIADKQGYTALARAVLRDNLPIARLLIKKGANIHSLTQEQNSLVMLAIQAGNQKMTAYLLTTPIDLDAGNNNGETAIMMAAGAGADAIIKKIIAAGADLQLRNQDDLNAYQIAKNSGHDKTAELIRSHSGTIFKLFN